jgi:hypothetical protein
MAIGDGVANVESNESRAKGNRDVRQFLTFLNILSHKQDREIGGGSIGRLGTKRSAENE